MKNRRSGKKKRSKSLRRESDEQGRKHDLTPLAQRVQWDIEQWTKSGGRPAFVLAFTKAPDYDEVFYVSSCHRVDGLKLLRSAMDQLEGGDYVGS